MINFLLAAVLFMSSLVPVAKWEADGGFEYNTDSTITITNIQYDEDNEPIAVSWESTRPVHLIDVKAGNETTPVYLNEPSTSGTVATGNGHAISGLIWYIDQSPTSVSVSNVRAFDMSDTETLVAGILMVMIVITGVALFFVDRKNSRQD